MRYRQSAVLERQIVFHGIEHNVGLPVESSLTWNAWRFGYELDVIVRDRGFLRLILEAKYTDARAEIDIYETVNLTRMVGVNIGYRSMDMNYLFDRDVGDFKVEGVYFSGLFRF